MKANEHKVTQRFIQVGTIKKSHGLSGEVLAAFAGRTSLHELVGTRVWITPPTERVHRGVFEKITLLDEEGEARLAIKGLSSLDDSSDLSRHRLICQREDVPERLLEEILDSESEPALLGFTVTSHTYGVLGEVVEYLETKANDCLVVEGKYGEVLLPVIDDVILGVDEENGTIAVHVLPGLIEMEPQCE